MTSPDHRKKLKVGAGRPGTDLKSVDDLNERQAASWMRQATAIPGFGGKKR